MKRTIAIRLDPSFEQEMALSALRAVFAAACEAAASIASEARCTNRVRLHHLAYYTLRARFPELGSQMVCNAIARVAQALRSARARKATWKTPQFDCNSSIHYDARTYRLIADQVSLYTMEGRQRIRVRMGDFQRRYIERGIIREADVMQRRGRWYLCVVLELPQVPKRSQGNVLGVDVGENVLAALSTGTLFDGGQLRDRRDRFLALRRRLQRNGSQSARQLLAKVSGQESRHVRHVNHEISSKIIEEAVEGAYGTIVMESLTNIRKRIKCGKRVRTRLHRWAWHQLQQFLAYKAENVGISVIYVRPAYTSQTCAKCNAIGVRRRHRFYCKACGIFAHSDRNAARNLAKIGMRALTPTGDVMRPNVAA